MKQSSTNNKIKQHNLDKKREIIDYLGVNAIATRNQLVRDLRLKDLPDFGNLLDDLIEEKKIGEIFNDDFAVYFLAHVNVDEKMDEIKTSVMNTVVKCSFVKVGELTGRVNDLFNADLSAQLIQYLTGKLVEEGSITAKTVGKSTVFYSSVVKYMKENSKTVHSRVKKTRILCKLYQEKLTEVHDLSEKEQLILNKVLSSIVPLVRRQDLSGRNYLDPMFIFSLIVVKKHVYLYLKKKPTFEDLKPWLHLHEILLENSIEYFMGRLKTYQHWKEAILTDPAFCSKEEIPEILNNPPDIIRIQFLIHEIGFSKENLKAILNFWKTIISMGYKIHGKNLKGVIAGILYLFSKQFKMELTQKEIAERLGVTEVTLRTRKKELENLNLKFRSTD